jgi:hypothetical protein
VERDGTRRSWSAAVEIGQAEAGGRKTVPGMTGPAGARPILNRHDVAAYAPARNRRQGRGCYRADQKPKRVAWGDR